MSAAAMAVGWGAGESIPREYHRRVLKKIAQLTKVVYALNTRNEEHESLVAALRSRYEERARQTESTAAAGLREMGEKVRGACEDGERRVEEVRRKLEEEREQLLQKQASQRRESEEQLKAVQLEHRQKVESLVAEVEKVSLQQAAQLKEVVQLREQARATLERREKELADKHEREMKAAAEEGARQAERCSLEVASAKREMEREMEGLIDRHRTELEAMKTSLMGKEKEKEAAEMQRWVERERALQEQMRLKEQSLAQRVSDLSEELRTARDQLAVTRQGMVEMEDQVEMAQSGVHGLHGELEEACREREGLREQVASLQDRVKRAEEEGKRWREKLSEKEDTATRQEAVHRETVSVLESQLSELQERLGEVEREREVLAMQHHSSVQQHSHSLTSIEKELVRLQRERDDLHSRYAREIEAAHASSGAREVELSVQHSLQLQEMRQQHERALLELRAAHEQSLEQLRSDLNSASEQEKQSLCSRHQEEVDTLKRELGEREARVTQLASQLQDAIAAVDEKRRGLGVVECEVERLKEEGREMRERERAARREATQLKDLVEKLKCEVVEAERRHKRELDELRSRVHADTQAECTETMKHELEVVRRKMTEEHAHSTRQALHALAQEKDDALSEARQTWEREQSSLREKIISLERKLMELQQASCVFLEEEREKAKKERGDLRESLEREKRSCVLHIEDLGRAHMEEVERVREEERGRGREEREQMREECRREAQQREMEFRDEVRLVREEGEREKREAVREEQESHRQEMASLQNALIEQQKREMESLHSEWEREREMWTREKQHLDSSREIEVSRYQQQLDVMKEEGERRGHDLSITRDSLHSLTEEAKLLRKQLEVRGRELEVAKREASNILRCREQELISSHHAEVESMSSQYRQQTQLLLNDFNKAKKMMTSKTAQLQRRVLELESLYQNRESRPEDVEAIRKLQREVKLYQTRLKEVEAEKQVYQLELVNREKNYNQIFSASPCVGVLNPLTSSKKKAPAQFSSRHSSAPSLSGDLPSLPALSSSTSITRLTASDVGLGGWSPPARPRPHQTVTQSPLTRKRLASSNRDGVY